MSSLIDISVPLDEKLPTWPGSSGLSLARASSAEEGAEATVSELSIDLHTGTHMDAPSHMIAGGETMAAYELKAGIGDALVVDTGDVENIDADALAAATPDPVEARILLRTANSRHPERYRQPFDSRFAALTESGARWLVERGVGLVGIDYLSIQRYADPIDTHLVLMRAGVSILEGLDLWHVEPGRYELLCLPIRLESTEAALARAVLRRRDG